MPQMRGFPSGESLRKAETRFLAKVRDRQEQFGAVWADAMSFALKVAGHRDVSLITNWEDASPVSEREMLENLRLKKELGISVEQALSEVGWDEIRRGIQLFLVNGVMLQGSVVGFDQFSVLLERDEQLQLVYKHAISTLQPPHPLDLGDHGDEPEEPGA